MPLPVRTRRTSPAWADSAFACQRAARKLQWGVQKERISETNEPVPLLMRPAVKEILQDAEQHRFDVLLIGNRDSLAVMPPTWRAFDCAELVQHPHLCRRPGQLDRAERPPLRPCPACRGRRMMLREVPQ